MPPVTFGSTTLYQHIASDCIVNVAIDAPPYPSGLTRLLDGRGMCQGCDLKVGVKVRCKVDVR